MDREAELLFETEFCEAALIGLVELAAIDFELVCGAEVAGLNSLGEKLTMPPVDEQP